MLYIFDDWFLICVFFPLSKRLIQWNNQVKGEGTNSECSFKKIK